MPLAYKLLMALIVYLALAALALNTGVQPLALSGLLRAAGQALLQPDTFTGLSTELQLEWQILRDIRAPRVLLASLVGASLGMAGAAMQGLLRNPLAEPGVVGVSAGAALAAVLVLYFGWVGWHSALLPLSAVIGSCAALSLVILLSGRQASVADVLLAGIAVSACLGAGIALALNFAPNPFAMQEISFWLMGSVAHRDLQQVAIVLPFMLVGVLLLSRSGQFLRTLTLGEVTAQSMGFHLGRQRLQILLATALLTGAAVAVAGVVGFVGLIVPHIVRLVAGEDPKRLLWWSAWLGGCFLLLVDTAVQWLSPASELKLGVLTSLLGGPFFMALLIHKRRSAAGWRSP